ncbi:hypothetical protein [Streptomyces olivaceiscleroticus]|uniref:Uncharacterized protein n=1 Tax=Streptomyces olivaceiscleroticus TaxID=68245 RepID=A0ABP3LL59_9ACTN
MTTTLAVAAALVAGYVLGRYQPSPRLLRWAEGQTRGTVRYWLAQPILAVAILVLLCTRPRTTIRNWKHRNDPPHREPALTFDPNWAENRRRAAKEQS